MDIAAQLSILEAARNPALLTLASVQLAHPELDEAELSATRDALLAAAVPHWFDAGSLAALIERPESAGRTHVARLRRLTVVEPFPARGTEAFNVHEAERLLLREHLRVGDPSRWRRCAALAVEASGGLSAPHQRIESLFHRFAFDPAAAAAQCEALDREYAYAARLDAHQALAAALGELLLAGWLDAVAVVEARLSRLHLRATRGEEALIEEEAVACVEAARAAGHRPGLGRALLLLADSLLEKGRIGNAEPVALEALEVTTRVCEASPDDSGRRLDCAVAHCRIGDVWQARGLLGRAGAEFEAYLRGCRALVEAHGGDVAAVREMGVALSRVAGVHEDQGRIEQGRRMMEDSLAVFERLRRDDPANAGWLRESSTARRRVGAILQSQGEAAAARAAFTAGLQGARELALRDPSSSGWQLDLASAFTDLAAFDEERLQYADAHAGFAQAHAIHDRLAEQDPSNDFLQRALAISRYRLEAVAAADDDAALLAAKLRYRDTCLEHAERDPRNVAWQSLLCAAWVSVGDQHDRMPDGADAARDAYQHYLDLSTRIAELDPSNTDGQRELAVAWSRVGDMHQSAERNREALEAYFRARDIFAELSALAPDNTLWKRDLAVTSGKVGSAHGDLDEWGPAVEAFKVELKLCSSLLALDPANAVWQRDLAFAQWRAGKMLQRAGEHEAARAAFAACVRLMERAVELAPGNAAWTSDLEAFRTWLE